MSSPQLPPVENFQGLALAEKLQTLDLLFEPSLALHSLVANSLAAASISSYLDLVSLVRDATSALLDDPAPQSQATLCAILGSHPRLGARNIESAQSAAEQARLQQGHEAERAQLASLNDEYEDRFRGLRYVVFVNGRGRDEIMDDMRARIERGDIEVEKRTALQVSLTGVIIMH